MTKAELLNLIKGYFITLNCGGEYNGKTFEDYERKARKYDERFAFLLWSETPEEYRDENRERWENEDYNWVLKHWMFLKFGFNLNIPR